MFAFENALRRSNPNSKSYKMTGKPGKIKITGIEFIIRVVKAVIYFAPFFPGIEF
jgi:hypothetical protein